MSTAERLAQEAKNVFEAADRQNRPFTADERIHVESLLDRAEQHHEVDERVNAFGRQIGAPDISSPDGTPTGRPGDMFVRIELARRVDFSRRVVRRRR